MFDIHKIEMVDNAKLDLIYKEMQKMSVELEALTAKVTALETVSESVVALLNGIKQKLDQVLSESKDFAALKAGVAELSNRVGQEVDDLSKAVTDNTPSEE